jgi:signal transduction histidine kinase
MLDIEDNGSGMTRQIIEKVWCLVATPFRKNETTSKRGRDSRRVTGAKGLGRLSAARLGKRLEMLTKTSDDECWQVDVTWAALSEATSLEECEVTIRKGDGAELKSESGTRLRILDLTTDWKDRESDAPENKIDELQEGLSRLNPPFDKFDKFTILLTRPETDSKPIEIKPSDLLENPVYRIEGSFTADGKLVYRYTYKPFSGSGRKRKDEKRWGTVLEDLKLSVKRARLGETKPSCGPFSFEIRAWDLDPDSVSEAVQQFGLRNKSAVRSEIRAFKGISLYRDNVLVLPKSESSRDWLGLDLRRVSKTGSRLSTSQVVGYVSIGADTNPGIADTSDRERLARSGEVEEFESLLQYAVTLLENERDQDRAKKEPEPTELFAALNAGKLVSDIQDLIHEKASASELLPHLTRFDEEMQRTRKRIERTFSHYSRLATIGLLAQQLVHEVGNNTSIIHEFIEVLKAHWAKTGEDHKPIKRALLLAESALASLQRLAERFRPLANRGFTRGKRKASFKETIRTCLEARKQEIERRNLKIELRLRDPDEVQTDPGELYAIFINLIDNALYWIERSPGKHERLLRIDCAHSRIKGRVECGVHDSGPGVPKEDHEKIFWPGFTHRPSGYGMGLTVAGEIVEGHGGRLRILDEGRLGGASFVFDLPQASN